MGRSPGAITRFMIAFAKSTERQVEANLLLTSTIFLCGYGYGSWKGGHLRDIDTQVKINKQKRDYERQQQLYTVRKMVYEAKAREVNGKAKQLNFGV